MTEANHRATPGPLISYDYGDEVYLTVNNGCRRRGGVVLE